MSSVMPSNIEAERSVLGALLTRPDFVAETALDLSPDDFYSAPNGAIWAAFVQMYAREGNQHPDVLGLVERSGNALSVTQLMDMQIEAAPFARSAVDSILRTSAARKIILENNKSNQDLLDGADPYETAAKIEKFASRVGSASTLIEQEAVTIDELSQRADAIAPVIIPEICNRDYRTIVVATEGSGKSLLLRTIAQTTAQGIHPFTHKFIEPKRTLVVDLENPVQSIIDTALPLECVLENRAGEDYDPERFRIWRRPGGINIRSLADRAALQREIAFHKPELVCIGPIYKMYQRRGGESYEDSADEAMAVLDDLRTRYDFALYMEHHAAKGKQGEKRELSPMGSQRWMAWPEIGISLYKDQRDPTVFEVSRFRGDRLQGVRWPDRIVRNAEFLIDGVYESVSGR